VLLEIFLGRTLICLSVFAICGVSVFKGCKSLIRQVKYE